MDDGTADLDGDWTKMEMDYTTYSSTTGTGNPTDETGSQYADMKAYIDANAPVATSTTPAMRLAQQVQATFGKMK